MTDDKKKREYTMSEAALEQRREASKKGAEAATGPRTEEGKAVSSRNNWKHGLYSAVNNQGLGWLELSAVKAFGRPCRKTCMKYPCSLVQDGVTDAGGDCYDKTVYVEAFNSIIVSLQDGNHDNTHAMLAAQMAGAIDLLQQIREEIGEQGIVRLVPFVDKEGGVVLDPEGNVVGKYVANPALPQYIKLLDTLGINLPELMATPKAIEGAKRAEKGDEAMRQFMEGIARAGGGGGALPPQVFDDVDFEEAGDE